MPCGQPEPVPGEHRVWRTGKALENHLHWNSDERRWMPRVEDPSNTVQFNPELSTVWAEHMEVVHSATVEAALRLPVYSLVFEAGVDALRARGAVVEHTPASEGYATDCAHTSVRYPEGATKSQKKAFRSDIAYELRKVLGTVPFDPPEGA